MTTADPTESIRREMIATAQPRADLLFNDEVGGGRWNTEEFQRDFDVIGFAAPFVVVVRKSDDVKGTVEFTASPERIYFGWRADL